MIIYCLKYKQETGTIEVSSVQSQNGRQMIKGKCLICGTKKSVFISMASVQAASATATPAASATKLEKTTKRKGFSLNNLIHSLPIEFHQYAEKREYVPGGSFNDQQKYSYCGPGTRYQQRIRGGYKGINELDKMC